MHRRRLIVDVRRHVCIPRRNRVEYFPPIMYSFHRPAPETHLNTTRRRPCICADMRSYLRLDYRIICRVSSLCRRNPMFVAEYVRRRDIRDWVLSSRCSAIAYLGREKRAREANTTRRKRKRDRELLRRIKLLRGENYSGDVYRVCAKVRGK